MGGVATAEPDELLSGALTRMRESEHSLMPVVRGGRVIGIVTLENIAELMMVHGALRISPRADRPARADEDVNVLRAST